MICDYHRCTISMILNYINVPKSVLNWMNEGLEVAQV